MDYTQIIRNLLTSELYDSNEFIFQMNIHFFYDLEDGLYRNPELNAYLKSILSLPNIDIYSIYTSTIIGEHNILFKHDFDKRIHDYLELDPEIEKNLEELVVPIHQIFYRFFIKGGAALKVFVDNLEKIGVIGKDIFIPGIANSPTDIDTNLVVNPNLSDVNALIQLLKSVIKTVCLTLIDKYSKIYWEIDNLFTKKLQENDTFIQHISTIFRTTNPIHIELPTEDLLTGQLSNAGETIKPQDSPIRLSILNPNHAELSIFRLLLCINITDVKYNLQTTDTSEIGVRSNRILLYGEAELIDITIYELKNPKYAQIWEWAKNAMPFGARYTLFQGIHEMIIDIIQMLDVKGNPSLIAKVEKRQQRLNYLYFLYCNYRMIQNILENNNKIKQDHISSYCSKLVEVPFFRLGLIKQEIDTILPYIIGYMNIQFDEIMWDFIFNYIYNSQNIQYKLDFNSSGFLVSSKLDIIDLEKSITEQDLEIIKQYLITISNSLNKNIQARLFVKLVTIYNESKNDGNTSLILLTSIVKATSGNPFYFSDRVETNYKELLRSIMSKFPNLFISQKLADIYKRGRIPDNYSNLILNETVGKMCKSVLNGLFPDLQLNMAILNKYAPYKIIYFSENEINFFILFERIIQLLDVYFTSLQTPFYITYELTKEYTIEIYYRLPIRLIINDTVINHTTDIKFCRLFFNKMVSIQNMIHIYEINNKKLYKLLR